MAEPTPDSAQFPTLNQGRAENPIHLLDSDSESEAILGCQSNPTSSLKDLAERAVLNELIEAVKGYQSRANYCLGGSIPTSSTFQEDYSSAISPPIVIRYDAALHTSKIELPLPAFTEDGIEQLVKACAPAKFGLGGKDVFDESYRKAGKLDKTEFSTNFHPYNFGIVDAIAQTLLPGIAQMTMNNRQGDSRNMEHWGVTAELYKLNIYSGPTGKFHAHVDTPRSATQFGSLVVCLPHPHQGGALKISHKGHKSLFDWSNEDSKDIKWAAFYSDCEHEVLNVKSGHRITLTYNLYVSEQIGGVLQRVPTADPTLYPLFEGAKQMLENNSFMIEGGTMGFHCAHQYAHTKKNTEELMPYALKGIDATLFMVFRALGVKVTVRPVLDGDAVVAFHQNRLDNMSDHSDDREDFHRISIVGDKFHELQVSDDPNEEGDAPWEGRWQCKQFRNIVWLNDQPDGGDIAMVNMKYGNEYSLEWSYSHAAILIDIPPRKERQNVPPQGTKFPNYYDREEKRKNRASLWDYI